MKNNSRVATVFVQDFTYFRTDWAFDFIADADYEGTSFATVAQAKNDPPVQPFKITREIFL